MTARDTYVSTVKTAAMTQTQANLLAEMTKQVTIDAQKTVVGYTLQSGNYSNLATAIKNAVNGSTASLLSNEQAKQTTINGAKDTLKSTGDLGPA